MMPNRQTPTQQMEAEKPLGATPKTAADSPMFFQTLQNFTSMMQKALTQPEKSITQTIDLAAVWAKAFTSRSDHGLEHYDRRFNDEAWQLNPFYREVMKNHRDLKSSIDSSLLNLDINERNQNQLRFALSSLMDALSPTNTLLGNPEALKRAYDTGGQSLLNGVRQYADDLLNNEGMPSLVNKSSFKVGDNLASTPGKVVYRTEMLELLQYSPVTENVFTHPLLMVPPQINKYYIYDMAPGRSLIEYAVSQGFQVFAISWRNPTKSHRDWGFEDYVKELEDASDVTCEISGSDKLNILGACAGGITTAALAGYLNATNNARINSVSLMVSILDNETFADTTLGLLATKEVLEFATRASDTFGVLDGQTLSKVFAWLRPNDLVWSGWVNNYLLGKSPPAFDLLYWNSDNTNLPAKLHQDFIAMIQTNPLVEPGKMKIDGTPIDLKQVRCDSYIVGGTTDHITPWQACYQTRELLGGDSTFVLSSGGHVQTIVNPPGNARSSFKTNESACLNADEFLLNAKTHSGSWWEHWSDWLSTRSGSQKTAPSRHGSEHIPTLGDAPGTYVLAR